MGHDRLIQALAMGVALVCLAAAVAMVPTINAQRRDLELSFDEVIGDRVQPRYAIATAALGSFRGLAVDVLWYRAERLKQEGKYYEAHTLAEWITSLQPRFPQVWSFHAWNMAYNISVATHTPEERWQWVNRGVRLLREQGIPNNPTSLRLYRELGWIFHHKMGRYTDDMHWYYKQKMAEQWQELLGTPTVGVRPDEAANVFAPIADAAEAYFGFDTPLRRTVHELQELAAANPGWAEELERVGSRTLVHLHRELPRLQQRLRDDGSHRLAEQLEPIRQRAERRLGRAGRSPWALLYEDHPAARPVVQRLQQAGYEVDEELVRRLGRLQMHSLHLDPEMLIERAGEALGLTTRDLMLLELRDDPETSEAFDALITFLRARALVRQYHMDPRFMHELMERFGPIDWRHPSAHGIYWSAKGSERARPPGDSRRHELLNTQRQVVHGVQELMHSGRVSFDPLTGHLDLLPEPAFIPSYEIALDQVAARAEELGYDSDGVRLSFEMGLENFLLRSIMYSYLYGDVEQAREYYQRARERFGGRPGDDRYTQTLEDLVLEQLIGNVDRMQIARQFIDAMIQLGLTRGLAQGHTQTFNRYVGLAEQMYDRFQAERYSPRALSPGQRERLQLPPTFQATLEDTYVNFMQSPRVDLLQRMRIYRNTPPALLTQVYPRLHGPLLNQARQAGFDAERMFPTPDGIDLAELERRQDEVFETIERQ